MLADRERFAWQCRRYLRWQAVQGGPAERDSLRDLADGLIDEGEVRTKHLANVSRVFEKVQRWRKDKEHLALEPDERPAYVDLRRDISIARKNPAVIGDLVNHRFSVNFTVELKGAAATDIFLALCIREFIRVVKKDLLWGRAETLGECPVVVGQALKDLYKIFGLRTGGSSGPSETLRQFLADIGIDADVAPYIPSAAPRAAIAASVIVETYEAPASTLLKLHFRRGALVVIYNTRHPWTSRAVGTGQDVEGFFRALGEAAMGMLGDIDILEMYFVGLGISLRRMVDEGS